MVDAQVIVALIAAAAAIIAAVIANWRKFGSGSRRSIRVAQTVGYPHWEDAIKTADKLLSQIQSEWNPGLVIGLGRSGGLWGGWLAGNLGTLPFAVVDVSYEDLPEGRRITFPGGAEVLAAIQATHGSHLRVLVVEGAASTGRTLREYSLQCLHLQPHWDVKFAVLYKNSSVAEPIHFVGEEMDTWPKRFPWHARDGWRSFTRYKPR